MNKHLLSVLTLLLACVLAPSWVSAETTQSWVIEKKSETIQLNDETTADIQNNEFETSVVVKQQGAEILEQTTKLSKITDVYLVEGSTPQLVVVYRADGSAQSLFFDVYQLNEGSADVVYESDAYDRATFEWNENEINIQYPIIGEKGVGTEPEGMASDSFIVESGDVVEKKQQEKVSLQNNVTAQSTGTEVNEKYENPSYAEINRMLTEEADNFGIPAEIVKAIAYQESGWQQYWDPDRTPVDHYENYCTEEKTRGMAWDGTNLKLGYDCIGIGIMQVSDYRFIENDEEREEEITKLATDMRYNIREGLKILQTKWNYADYDLIPSVNNGDKGIIENWYFAILAYNGLSERNDPLAHAYTAYQEKIYQRLRVYGLLDVTPFPTHTLTPEVDGILTFGVDNVETTGPVHTTKNNFQPGERVYVTAGSLNMRVAPNGSVITGLERGDALTITDVPVGSDSNTQHWSWYPVKTSNGTKGYVASSFLSKEKQPHSYRLAGVNRYETSTALSNYGWHWNDPSVAVIGRGDLPIDSLTGSVLASFYDSPLLLTQTDTLPASVQTELNRMNPDTIYLLGSEAAVGSSVEEQLNNQFGASNVVRLSGATRFETAYEVADEVAEEVAVDEIFITTSDETSPDALSIASYAGQEHTPIMLTLPYKLEENIIQFIRENNVEKATIIGGSNAVHNKVEEQLKREVDTVERVSGSDRYSTSVEIAEKYFISQRVEDVFFARGHEVVDALSGSPLAASLESPIILTETDQVPSSVRNYIDRLSISPQHYYLGGNAAISEKTENDLESIRN
ncbi:cell wall-binding repeat-containing protein [Halobacillus litoralis]|uniref:cell wall-binding repeat-containing protein n=1 Tax=Halobacillus litoralis TaxID=45668 RepID=UPI001CFCC1F1|nr:cell wall-binding repeat-containing protein [Halobacillus litoralis]